MRPPTRIADIAARLRAKTLWLVDTHAWKLLPVCLLMPFAAAGGAVLAGGDPVGAALYTALAIIVAGGVHGLAGLVLSVLSLLFLIILLIAL
jgi:hypothetical protein